MLKFLHNIFLSTLISSSCFSTEVPESHQMSLGLKAYQDLAKSKHMVWNGFKPQETTGPYSSPRDGDEFYKEMIDSKSLYKKTHKYGDVLRSVDLGNQLAFIDYLDHLSKHRQDISASNFNKRLTKFSEKMQTFALTGSPVAFYIIEYGVVSKIFVSPSLTESLGEIGRATLDNRKDLDPSELNHIKSQVKTALNRVIIADLEARASAEKGKSEKAFEAQSELVSHYLEGGKGFKKAKGRELALKYGKINPEVAKMTLEAFNKNKLGFRRNTKWGKAAILDMVKAQANRGNQEMQLELLQAFIKGKYSLDSNNQATKQEAFDICYDLITKTETSDEFKETFIHQFNTQWRKIANNSENIERYEEIKDSYFGSEESRPWRGFCFSKYAHLLLEEDASI